MKKIFLIIGIATCSACSSFLDEDPRGQVLGDNAISTAEGLDAALTGTYKGFLRTWSRGFLTNGSLQGTTAGGDDLTTLPDGNKEKWRELDQFEVNDLNPHILQVWNGCYKTIQGANNIINNYHKTSGDPVLINQIAGEAYFLRGLAYYWLVRCWGRVPLISQAEFSEDLLHIGLSETTEIYALVESDLKLADELMGNAKRNPGRPNRGSAKALLADVYLTQGGWPVKDASKYALAAAKAKEVIDHKADYGFGLVPELTTLWPGATYSIATPEEVMAFHASADFGGSVNAFWGDSGRPGESGGWDDYFAEVTFFNNFPEGKRKDATFLTEWHNNATGTTIQWQDSKAKHPYFKKFALVSPIWASGMPVHIMRYAHVLLIYAEAKARSGGADDLAYEGVNAVRDRAGLDPLDAGMPAEDFAEAIVNERAWEFAGEWCRWFDLVRLERVEEANANKHANDLKPIGTISKADYLFPIPAQDSSVNPDLLEGE